MWANGNGGPGDDCAASGYQSSMYTISIGSIGADGRPSSYDEQCSAKMAVTYVTNQRGDSSVVWLHHSVTKQHLTMHHFLF